MTIGREAFPLREASFVFYGSGHGKLPKCPIFNTTLIDPGTATTEVGRSYEVLSCSFLSVLFLMPKVQIKESV